MDVIRPCWHICQRDNRPLLLHTYIACLALLHFLGVARYCKCFFFFFLRRYNFKEVLTFSKNSFNLGRFLIQSFQLVILMFTTSLLTSSSHMCLGLPFDLVDMGVHSYTFFTMLSSAIRYTCPNQANLCALMCFVIFLLPISLFSMTALIRRDF